MKCAYLHDSITTQHQVGCSNLIHFASPSLIDNTHNVSRAFLEGDAHGSNAANSGLNRMSMLRIMRRSSVLQGELLWGTIPPLVDDTRRLVRVTMMDDIGNNGEEIEPGRDGSCEWWFCF